MICDDIATHAGSLFQCEEVAGRTRIRTPFVYPDGDIIDLFVVDNGNGVFSITDFGEALQWLRQQTPAMRRTPRQRTLINMVCETHQVRLQKGVLYDRVRDPSNVADVVMRVGQAVSRIADISFTLRHRSVQSTADEVANLLDERNVTFDRRRDVRGFSERPYKVDIATKTDRPAFVQVLATASSGSASNMTDNVFTMWSDIRRRPDAPRLVSLIDDSSDIWDDSSLKLLEDVSVLAFWSKPDDVADLLAA